MKGYWRRPEETANAMRVLYERPAVLEAAVIGIHDDTLGEEVGAALVRRLRADTDADEIRAFVKDRDGRLQVRAEDLVPRRATKEHNWQGSQAGDSSAR